MVVQHNMTAANTNRMLGNVVNQQAKATEKLSSGYRINRAADDAAGLSISEKMRSQIRGLNQASTNAQDGISLIQTAEGGLNETHSILQRMRELAVQASNGTNTDSDRDAITSEVEQLKEELTRISDTTEFNTMKLLDGSLSGASSSSTSAGPKFGVMQMGAMGGAFLTSNVKGVQVKVVTKGDDPGTDIQVGTESAIWDKSGKVLTLNLAEGQSYKQEDIANLIKNAEQEDSEADNVPAEITLKWSNGTYTAKNDDKTSDGGTVAGAKATAKADSEEGVAGELGVDYVGVNSIELTSNKYGAEYNGMKITIKFDAKLDSENVTTENPPTYDEEYDSTDYTGGEESAQYILHLQTGKEYTEEDIEDLLKQNGLDMDIKFSSSAPDEPNTLKSVTAVTSFEFTLEAGAGLGDDDALFGQANYSTTSAVGKGMTLHIGANEGQTMSFNIDSMSARSLGVANINVSNAKGAESAISDIDAAIKKVSVARSNMGAVQNRLEHTISNLDNTAENLQTAESNIRDVDMASEMVEYSKNNILQQAAQSMLAQANQANQGVLSLLR